ANFPCLPSFATRIDSFTAIARRLIMNPDMVDSCQEKKELPANCFSAVLAVVIFQGIQRGGTGFGDGRSL
ncbi:hypothetical protein, partial [Desulfosarcina sp.]|uniref:hypothetical protein n=1 Tax=Desulfosarcina sp. TaxID=2027861 RepID=UPI003568C847